MDGTAAVADRWGQTEASRAEHAGYAMAIHDAICRCSVGEEHINRDYGAIADIVTIPLVEERDRLRAIYDELLDQYERDTDALIRYRVPRGGFNTVVKDRDAARAAHLALTNAFRRFIRHGEDVPADVTTYDRSAVHMDVLNILDEHGARA